MIYHTFNPGTGQEQQIHANVLNSKINETLGQINYILTDKTGTLTQNSTKFHRLIIGRYLFYKMKPSEEDANDLEKDLGLVDILKDQGGEGEKTRNALRCLCLCHSVLYNENVALISPSPDDLEFLEFTSNYGFIYQVPELVDKENWLIINEFDEDVKYRLLEKFDFTPERRRSSIIVEKNVDGKPVIYMFTKGADEELIPRLNMAASGEVEAVLENIEKYSKEGFRMLMITIKRIRATEWKKFSATYSKLKEKSNDINDLYKMQNDMENELELLGVVSFEENLQDKVYDTIKFIRAAKIKTWIATGDKANTALAVAKNAGLVFENTLLLRFFEIEKIQESVFVEIDAKMRAISKGIFACCIIDGPYWAKILEYKKTNVILYEEFVDIVMRSEVAIFARIYPQQKEEIVRMIKQTNPKLNILAIGDAYNDSYMLNLADVGVAIKTVDHSLISKISDYSIGEFRLLMPLIFYFGRESYRKNSMFILFSFYKNSILIMPQFWNGFLNFFSGFPLYDELTFQLYHVLYTSMPIIYFGLYDKVYQKSKMLFSPLMYKTGTDDFYFSKFNIRVSQVFGVFFPFLLTFTCLSLFDWGNYLNGWTFGFFIYGNMCFYSCVIIINLGIFIISNSFSIIQIVLVIVSIAFFVGGWFYQNLNPLNSLYQTFFETVFSMQFFVLNAILIGIVIIQYTVLRLIYFVKETKYIPDFDLKFDANAAQNVPGEEENLAISGVSDNQEDVLIENENTKKKILKQVSLGSKKSSLAKQLDESIADEENDYSLLMENKKGGDKKML